MSHSITSRRSFIKTIAASGAIAGAVPALPGPRKTTRPNLLFIITDQQSATMLSAAGNRWLKTPASDRLAATGVRFEQAYCADPVCLPSRFSFMTGRYPSAVGVRHNGSKPSEKVNSMPGKAMGHFFRAAGYETVYGGKVHLPGPMKDVSTCGFHVLTADQRDQLADVSADYVRGKHDKPFLMVASFINPHDICYMAIRDYPPARRKALPALEEALKMPAGTSEQEFYRRHTRPLPPNFEIPKNEPDAITWLTKLRPFRQNARDNWDAEQWRLHRWAYCRLTERVEAQIGRLLDALDETGLADNTLVVRTADHGDMDSAHRMEHKTVFYQEAARIPMIVRYPGHIRAGHVDRTHLVNNGLDLIPTLCDYAGMDPPADLPGRTLRPLLEGPQPANWRKTLYAESQIGYMVTDGRYKYCAYDADKGPRRESLVDLEADPGEMNNLAGDSSKQSIVKRLRIVMAGWHERNGIRFAMPS